MKSISRGLAWGLALTIATQIVATGVSALTVDDSLISKPTVNAPNYALQTFKSCSDMRTKVADFMELYYDAQGQNRIYPRYYKGEGEPVLDSIRWGSITAPTASAPSSLSKNTDAAIPVGPSAGADFSQTNTRTFGVDEPEKVKTDGQYLYTARPEDRAIYINRANDSLELVTKILLPEEFNSAELFLDGNRMIVVAGKYFWNEGFRNAWIDRSNKSIVIVYDITNRAKPVIERYTQIDGAVKEARMIDGQLTLMSTTSFNFPYERYMPKVRGNTLELDMDKLSAEFSTKNILPRQIDFVARKNTANVDTAIKTARDMRRLVEKEAAGCAEISYVLPDADTLANYNFNPSFTSVTRINVRKATVRATSSLIFGDADKTYLAASGKLYLTSQLYSNSGWSCPSLPNIRCAAPFIRSGTRTVIHQFDTNFLKPKYLQTTLVEWNLINDYAIDEAANGQLRLVTQRDGEKRESALTILSPSFGKVGELTGLGVNENFQSARFIGDRLYLVTFEQIDPLYVVDLSNSAAPKVLGELKIPGYSTYLHPYDENRLIGIGYDTTTNEWGGTMNSGVKIDLYNVSDVKNPKQEGTLTLGGAGSYSEALNNPRLFVWNAARKTLYMPAQLNTPVSAKEPYNYKDIFQGVVAVSINPADTTGIVREIARTTHLVWDDAALTIARDKECAQYKPQVRTCRKLVSGEEVCTDGAPSYIPSYCYADAGLGAFKAQSFWNQSERFIDRVMYSGSRVYTLSRAQIQSLDIAAAAKLEKKGSVALSPIAIKAYPVELEMPVPMPIVR
jgi:inhibitor of cysteine peptidase